MKDKAAKRPWIVKELLPYRPARQVLGVMAAGQPDADQYEELMKEKVVRLIRQAPDLEPIDTNLLIPLDQLDDPKDPEVVYQDIKDMSEQLWPLVADLKLYLRGKMFTQELKKSRMLPPAGPVVSFRQELEQLTLDEFLEAATSL